MRNNAKENGCKCLRMDTNELNKNARSFYNKLGYSEAGILPCVFNGIPGIRLVMLEKVLKWAALVAHFFLDKIKRECYN